MCCCCCRAARSNICALCPKARFKIVPYAYKEYVDLKSTAVLMVGDKEIKSNTTVAKKVIERRGKFFIRCCCSGS